MRAAVSAGAATVALALVTSPAGAMVHEDRAALAMRAKPSASIAVSDVTPTLGQPIKVTGHVKNDTGRKSVQLQVLTRNKEWSTVQRFEGATANYRYAFKHTYQGHRAIRVAFRSRGMRVTSEVVGLEPSSLRAGAFLNFTYGAPRDTTSVAYAQSGAPEIVLGMIGSRAGISPCAPAMLSGDPQGDVPLLSNGSASPSVQQFIATLKASGIKSSFAFGGEGVPALWGNCSDPLQLQDSLDQLATAYPDIQSWVFDIEAPDQLDATNIDRLVQALEPVTVKHGDLDIWWAVQVWPTGITTSQAAPGIPATGLYALRKAASFSDGATIMCQGFPANHGTVEQMCEDAAEFVVNDPEQFPSVWTTLAPKDLWAKLGLTVQTGVAYDNPTPVTIEQMGALRSFALKNDVGAILNWSLNQDFSANGICPVVSATSLQYCLGASGVTDQTRDWQFVQTAAGK